MWELFLHSRSTKMVQEWKRWSAQASRYWSSQSGIMPFSCHQSISPAIQLVVLFIQQTLTRIIIHAWRQTASRYIASSSYPPNFALSIVILYISISSCVNILCGRKRDESGLSVLNALNLYWNEMNQHCRILRFEDTIDFTKYHFLWLQLLLELLVGLAGHVHPTHYLLAQHLHPLSLCNLPKTSCIFI